MLHTPQLFYLTTLTILKVHIAVLNKTKHMTNIRDGYSQRYYIGCRFGTLKLSSNCFNRLTCLSLHEIRKQYPFSHVFRGSLSSRPVMWIAAAFVPSSIS